MNQFKKREKIIEQYMVKHKKCKALTKINANTFQMYVNKTKAPDRVYCSKCKEHLPTKEFTFSKTKGVKK